MRYSDEDLGYVFISESSVSDEHKTVSNIDVRNDDNLFYITFHTNLQSFGDINRNRRRYLGDNVWGAIQKDNRLQCFLRDNCWFGEFEHPAPEYTDKKMTPQRMQLVLPANRAFKILRPKLCGNILEADIQSAQGSVGEGFGKEVLAGWIPSFSLRAIAALKMYQNVPTVFVRKVITYDSVWYPSHEIARATSKPSAHLENIRNFCESAVDNIAASVRNVMIPLKEILESVGNTDVNTQMILESFELTDENLYGFTPDHKHVIIKDEDNTIYANISPKTKKRVDDFFNSFM